MLGSQLSHLSEMLNGKCPLTTELAVRIEEVIASKNSVVGTNANELEIANNNVNAEDNQHETVALTIPIHDRYLLQELVCRFGWACVF